jgi:hypothetical protein
MGGPLYFPASYLLLLMINTHFLHIDLTEWVCENPRIMRSLLPVRKNSG